jgi:hypothetical protein
VWKNNIKMDHEKLGGRLDESDRVQEQAAESVIMVTNFRVLKKIWNISSEGILSENDCYVCSFFKKKVKLSPCLTN